MINGGSSRPFTLCGRTSSTHYNPGCSPGISISWLILPWGLGDWFCHQAITWGFSEWIQLPSVHFFVTSCGHTQKLGSIKFRFSGLHWCDSGLIRQKRVQTCISRTPDLVIISRSLEMSLWPGKIVKLTRSYWQTSVPEYFSDNPPIYLREIHSNIHLFCGEVCQIWTLTQFYSRLSIPISSTRTGKTESFLRSSLYGEGKLLCTTNYWKQ